MQQRQQQLGALPSFELEETVPLPSSSASNSSPGPDSRLRKFWESKSIACGGNSTLKWLFVLLNIMWFTLLVIHIRYSSISTLLNGNGNGDESVLSTMSLGQQSAWLRRSKTCGKLDVRNEQWAGDLREFEGAWNRLCFGHPVQAERMRIGAFVKTWPMDAKPGGLEHHARVLYHDLARRGHQVHVFTTISNGENVTEYHLESNNLHIHIVHSELNVTAEEQSWQTFLDSYPFDVVHIEDVSLAARKAIQIRDSPTAATWHGINAECIHSDILMERLNPRFEKEFRSEEQQRNLYGRLNKIVEEAKVFRSYGHHVAISDYNADVLRTIYEIPVERVHTIFNGVDGAFEPNPAAGAAFRENHGVPQDMSTLVFGVAGRLVKDKGHPLLYEAFAQILQRHRNVYLLVAGSGPWLSRYAKLGSNVVAVGPLSPQGLNGFYNSLDVFLNPTLRSQGLDLTLMEALRCGKPLMATHFASIAWSVIIGKEFGTTFAPNVGTITAALEGAIRDGREKLALGWQTRVDYARMMFTAETMGAAYERLFLCLRDEAYCAYPLPADQCRGDDDGELPGALEGTT